MRRVGYIPRAASTKASSFHPASHHGDKEKNIEEFFQINRYHVGLLPYFFEKLQSLQEEGASLLDKTMVIYGSPMGDPNVHNHKRCPLFVVGGASGNTRRRRPSQSGTGNVDGERDVGLDAKARFRGHGKLRRQHRSPLAVNVVLVVMS